MRCPNRCDSEVLQTVKVQRVILNQLMGLAIRCELCSKFYELGDREAHFAKYCNELVVETCVFPDCKAFEPCKREEFERHLLQSCPSKAKQCNTCGLDLYKMYENDAFREKVSGHICNRDSLLFLWEALMDSQAAEEAKNNQQADSTTADGTDPEESKEPAVSRHQIETTSPTIRPRLESVRESLIIARECSSNDQIEFSETTCMNGHDVRVTTLDTDGRF